ncbi:hypothetical protein D3C84_630780 [compost metagenome]
MNGGRGTLMPPENMSDMKCTNFKSIPMRLLMPYEEQALRNHSQSLQRLAERGGMAACEILGIIRGSRWSQLKVTPDDEAELIEWVASES